MRFSQSEQMTMLTVGRSPQVQEVDGVITLSGCEPRVHVCVRVREREREEKEEPKKGRERERTERKETQQDRGSECR